MFIENGTTGVAGLGLAIVHIKTAAASRAAGDPLPDNRVARRIALVEEAGGLSVEKVVFSGEAAAVQPRAIEMIKAGRKMALEGFPLEEIAAWCFQHNY